MKNTPASARQIRLQKLFATHKAVKKAIKNAIEQVDQSEIFGEHPTAYTPAAAPGSRFRTVTMTASEAHDLVHFAIPPSARTIPARQEHALLMIAIAQLLDELAAITGDLTPYEAIAAAQHLLHQVKDWLAINNQVVMRPTDKWSDSMIGRPRFPDAQARLPRNREQTTFNNPFFSWHNSSYVPPKHAPKKPVLNLIPERPVPDAC